MIVMKKYLTLLIILVSFSIFNSNASVRNDTMLVKKISACFDLHETFLDDGKSVFILLEYSRTKFGDTLIIKNKLDVDKKGLLKESIARCRVQMRNYNTGDLLITPIIFINANNDLVNATFDNLFPFFQSSNLYLNKAKILKTILILGMGPKSNSGIFEKCII